MFWSYRSTGSYPPYPIHNERRVLMTINRRPTERTKRTNGYSFQPADSSNLNQWDRTGCYPSGCNQHQYCYCRDKSQAA